MKNITEILREQGFEMDDDKARAVEKAVLESYRTTEELNGKAAKLDAANARIAELEAQSSELTDRLKALDAEKGANAEAVSALQAKVAEFEQAEADRKAKQEAAEREAKFREAFDAAVGDRRFANEFVRDSIFRKSIEAREADPVKGYGDIIADLTKDVGGVWENPQTDPKNLPRPGEDGGDTQTSKPTFKHFF